MSYILAALKKSELERKQLETDSDDKAAAQVSALSKPYELSASSETRVVNMTSVSLFMMAILIVLLSYWLLDYKELFSSASGSAISGSAIKDSSIHNSLKGNSLKDDSLKDKSVIIAEPSTHEVLKRDEVIESAAIEHVVIEPTAVRAAVIEESTVEVIDIEQADQAQLIKIPSLIITSHIYSSQANRRSIVINNERLVEGDYVANQVQIKEITHQGMILNVDGLLFAVSRSRGWNR
jgi:general secretion pathway protein B